MSVILTARPLETRVGRLTTLSWKARGASQCSSNWGGQEPIFGKEPLRVHGTKTYTLSCTAPDGKKVNKSVTVKAY
jgi:hypothetical protein